MCRVSGFDFMSWQSRGALPYRTYRKVFGFVVVTCLEHWQITLMSKNSWRNPETKGFLHFQQTIEEPFRTLLREQLMSPCHLVQ